MQKNKTSKWCEAVFEMIAQAGRENHNGGG